MDYVGMEAEWRARFLFGIVLKKLRGRVGIVKFVAAEDWRARLVSCSAYARFLCGVFCGRVEATRKHSSDDNHSQTLARDVDNHIISSSAH